MLLTLARNWWVLVLRGVLAVLLGVIAFFMPEITLTALVLLWGAYALLDGLLAFGAAIAGGGGRARWWALVLEGVAGILAAVATIAWPGVTALVLLYLIAAWAIVTGVLEIVAAVRLRREIEGEWLLGLSGVASVVFGLYVAAFPGAGAVAVVWIIGLYALLFGVLLIALGFRLRGRRHAAAVSMGRMQSAGSP